MRAPKNPGLVILAGCFATVVAALTWNDRHDLLTGTTRRGYPLWLLAAVLFVLCGIGLWFGWRRGPGDRD